MRVVMLILFSIMSGGVASGQTAPAAGDGAATATARTEKPEEVVVRGR